MAKKEQLAWDSFSYCLMMAHNVYNHITAVQIANDMNDIEQIKHKPDIGHWAKTKASDNTGELSEFVPKNILYFNHICRKSVYFRETYGVISANKSFSSRHTRHKMANIHRWW